MAVKERPILFDGPMVRAILKGRKTQTRRVIKLPSGDWSFSECFESLEGTNDYVAGFWQGGDLSVVKCPYGKPGDNLWVRESFCPDWCDHIIYKADGGSARESGYESEPKWKPSIHMPRAASRILLEVVGVRVERVQDISDADIEAEGVDNGKTNPTMGKRHVNMQRMAWIDLWDSINVARGYGWKSNPWVWVVEFKVIGV